MAQLFARVVSCAAVVLFVAGGCSTSPTRSNPYDPEGTGEKKPGRITGLVFVQGASSLADFEVHVLDGAQARVDGGMVTATDGAFTTPELEPGSYRIEVGVPVGNVPIRVDGVEVVPGATTDVGLLTSLTEPPIGRIEGLVELEDTALPPVGVRVVASRVTGSVRETWVGSTDATGAYLFREVPAGHYEVRADRTGFTPDLVETDIASSTRAVATPATMKLYPASAVVRFSSSGAGGQVVGAPYTRSTSVSLVLLAFGGVNEMRFSESSDLTEAGADVPWRDYIAETPFTLSAGEGGKTVYAQFRVVDTAGTERLRTETYQASIVYDATPPSLLSLELAPGALEEHGVRYLTAGDSRTSVPVELVAVDPYSRLAGVKVVVEDADAATVPYTVVAAVDATATWSSTVALSAGDGPKVVGVQLRDAAGNETALVTATVVVDTTGPALHVDPALAVTVLGVDKDGASSARTRTPNVVLSLSGFADAAAGSGATHYMISESGAFSDAVWMPCPVGSCDVALPWTLSSADGDKVLHAKVRDLAGNESAAAASATIRLDTTPPTLAVGLLGTTIAVNDSSQYTHDPAVQVTPVATDAGTGLAPGTSLMQVSDVASFTGAAWTTLATTSFTLNGDDGQKRVYVRVRDLAGNETVADASIVLDRVGPYFGSVVIDAGAAYASATGGHTLTLSASDALSGIAAMRVGNGSGAGTFESYGATKTGYELAAGAGTRSVYATFRDQAGNVGAEVADDIVVDLAGPSAASFSVEAGAADYTGACGASAEHWVSRNFVTLNLLTGTDDVGIAEFKVAEDANFGAVAWMPWPGAGGIYRFALSSGDGAKTVSLRVRDHVEREYDAANVCVTLDTTPPVDVAVATYTDAGCTTPAVGDWFPTTSFYLGITATDEATYGSPAFARFDDNTDVDSFYAAGAYWYDSQGVGNHYDARLPPLMPFTTCLRGTLAITASREVLYLSVRDEVGNWTGRTPVYVNHDPSAPLAPTVTSVTAKNKALELFWSGATDAESGIQKYQVQVRKTQPTTTGWAAVDVDAAARSTVLTGLDNRARYEVQVRAVNKAGTPSGWSTVKAETVGLTRSLVSSSPLYTVIPFGVQERDGVTYVGFLEAQTVSGQLASTLVIALSSDGGVTWERHTVDPYVVVGRETAGLYVGSRGIVVMALDYANRPSSWRSSDNGIAWTKTLLDGTNAAVVSAGLAATRDGGVLAAIFQRASDFGYYLARSYDGGGSWVAVEATLTDTNALTPHFLGLCNTQFKLPWFSLEGGSLSLMYSEDMGYQSYLDATPGAVTGVGRAAITCNDPISIGQADGKGYLVYTTTVGGLLLRENDFAGSLYWDTDPTVLKASGVEPLTRPAVYAGGRYASERIFVAYRASSSGVVWLGTTTDPDLSEVDAGGLPTKPYEWVEADSSGSAGLYLVMNGTALGSPLLAYASESGHDLYVLRTVLPAPEPNPSISEGDATLAWWSEPGAAGYRLTGGASPVDTVDMSYSTASGNYPYTLASLDEYGQTGEPGTTWQLAPFTAGATMVTGTANATTSSRFGRLWVSGSTLVGLPPLGFARASGGTPCDTSYDICLGTSIDSGATWTAVRAQDMTKATASQSMAVGTSATKGHQQVYVAYLNDDPTPHVEVATNDFNNVTGAFDLTWSTTILDADAYTPSAIQVATSGAYAIVAWVVSTTQQAIRYRYSSDYGANWSATHTVFNSTALGYTPAQLNVVYFGVTRTTTEALFAWANGSSDMVLGWSTNIDAATPTWSSVALDTNASVAAIDGVRYGDNWLVAFIGTGTASETRNSVWAFLGGGESAPPLVAGRWALVHLDAEEAIPESLNTYADKSGAYAAYGTVKTVLGTTFRQLKLGYCLQECAGPDNWATSTVRYTADDDASGLGENYRGALIAVDPSTETIYVGGANDPNGWDFYTVSRGARITRYE